MIVVRWTDFSRIIDMGCTLQELIKERILILDGAMGTMIQQFHLTEEDFRRGDLQQLPVLQKGNNDILSLSRPDVIETIHRSYLEAGADIIETNTFSAQRISMADYHCEHLCRDINRESVRIARRLADEFTDRTPEKPRFVAGSVGPTNRTCSMSPDVNDPALRNLTFDQLAEAYREQMEVMLEEGVDAILIETIFDTLNAKAALYAAEEAMANTAKVVPLMLSVTIADKAGRTLSGQSLGAFLASVSHAPIFSVGLNCSFGASEMKPFLEELARQAPYYISVYPNAGLPNSMGKYDQTPSEMAEMVEKYIEEGLVNIIGGCCGTTDAFIAEYPGLLRKDGMWRPPHVPVPFSKDLTLSGLDVLSVRSENNFTNVGERCNVAGSRKFLRLIREKNYEEAIGIARQQVEDGAQILDINMDDGLLETKEEMVHFLNLLAAEPEIARVPLMIDSSRWEVITAALKCVQGKCIVNSISLKEGETAFLNHAREIRRLGAAVVVMAFDEKGQADTFERRIEICERAYSLLTEKVGFNPADIIFDPNVLAVCTGMPEHDNYALDYIRATAWIRQNLPYAHVSGGVSNLSFSFRGNNYVREAMHAVFLYHAIRSGMDMGIVNPSSSVLYGDIPRDFLGLLEDVVLNRRPASEELIAKAEELQSEAASALPRKEAKNHDGWRQASLEERLHYALLKGVGDCLEEDLADAIGKYDHAVDIIEGPLMEAMNDVGELFGCGKMFLPQVVKTARTMKKAVGILQPHIEAEMTVGKKAGKAVLATVKGDVHDIGKNIVSVVLACNNYDITDLGVMCPAETIVEAALSEKADFVGLSGLITPSLDEMINTVRAMKQAGLSVPVLLGGATTSKMHTALKIAPEYDGPVIWVKDASQMVLIAARLMSPATRGKYIEEIRAEYAELCAFARDRAGREIVQLEEARRNKLNLF